MSPACRDAACGSEGRPPVLDRLRRWWRARPLGTVFVAYLAGYLVLATAGTALVLNVVDGLQSEYYTVELDVGGGGLARASIETGPYIYDAATDELIPATELDLPGDNPYAVFVGVKHGVEPDRTGLSDDEAAALDEGEPLEVNATMEAVRAGTVDLYDWGLNYNYLPGFTSDDVLDDRGVIAPDRVAEYDRRNRAGRVDAIGLFEDATGVDLAQAFGETMVSNVAYYADSVPTDALPYTLGLVLNMVAPFALYGGLAWVMFRRFYRVHIAAPLDGLAGAARRIAEQDLDFSIEPVRGRELGALRATLEEMRASLLAAQRELWRTAEERRRLNAAFAHDLRTPVTVLRGTIDLGRMRIARGEAVGSPQLDVLSDQVERLSRYADTMSGLTKLEDRALACEPSAAGEVVCRLRAHAGEVVAARGGGLRLEALDPDSVGAASLGDATVAVDLPLAEEVLDNLLNNACGHAVSTVRLGVRLDPVPPASPAPDETPAAPARAAQLVCIVEDDGPGFSAEALRRAREPFFSEAKSAEHFGVGLNIADTLTELHGGALELGCADGGGARVTARFTCGYAAGMEFPPSAGACSQG